MLRNELSLLTATWYSQPRFFCNGQIACNRLLSAERRISVQSLGAIVKSKQAAASASRMCSMHGCCDHGIHSEQNSPNFRHGPDRARLSRDIVFGGERAQTTVNQPREVTRLSSHPDRSDRRENTGSDHSMNVRGSDRRDNTLHSRSDNSMNARVSDINSNTKHAHVVISGKVQGVSYRRWTVENATKLALNGWVRNCKDGTVEAVFSGKSSAVDHMLDRCKIGSTRARVANVTVTPAAGPPKEGFEQLDDKRW